jgi:hypothetical protein
VINRVYSVERPTGYHLSTGENLASSYVSLPVDALASVFFKPMSESTCSYVLCATSFVVGRNLPIRHRNSIQEMFNKRMENFNSIPLENNLGKARFCLSISLCPHVLCVLHLVQIVIENVLQ